MAVFYICRHGETENNRMRRLSGWIDTPLTEEGLKNAISSASQLEGIKFDVIVSSDLGRAFITAYVISRELGYSSEITRLRGLREVNYGDLANKPYKDYPDISPSENTNYLPPGGESLATMQKRVLDCVSNLSELNKEKTILIVAHDGTINAIRANYSNETMAEADGIHNPHDFVAKFEIEDGKVISFTELRV